MKTIPYTIFGPRRWILFILCVILISWHATLDVVVANESDEEHRHHERSTVSSSSSSSSSPLDHNELMTKHSTMYTSQIHLKNWTQHAPAEDGPKQQQQQQRRVAHQNSAGGYHHHHHHHVNHPQHPKFFESFPNFIHATMNQVVLEPGDVLFLPTHWIHHVVS